MGIMPKRAERSNCFQRDFFPKPKRRGNTTGNSISEKQTLGGQRTPPRIRFFFSFNNARNKNAKTRNISRHTTAVK